MDSIEAHRRGCYVFNFSYRIDDVVGVSPITFDVLFKGSANQWVTQQPFLHQYPERDCHGSGFITVWIDSPDAPLSLGDTQVRLRARDSGDRTLARVTITPGFDWYKSYGAITRQNLVDYWAGPDAAAREVVGLNEGPYSLKEYFHGRYDREPAMLVFETADGGCCAGMFLPHLGADGLEGLWIIDMTCFDASLVRGNVDFLDGNPPASDDDFDTSRRSYDNAGLLTRGNPFDLDRSGVFKGDGEGDIVVQVNDDGKHVLRAINGCRMSY